MKKTLLLMSACCVAASVNAQMSAGSLVKVGGMQAKQQILQNNKAFTPFTKGNSPSANKTTLGGSRWYNYVDYLTLVNSAIQSNSSFPYMWNTPDMGAIYSDASGNPIVDTIQLASYGMTFDPISQSDLFNDPFAYPNGEIAVRSTNPYTLDSVTVYGTYGRNPNKTTVIDTLRFAFIYGNGTNASNMPTYYFDDMSAEFGYDTVRFGAIWHDVVGNTADQNPNATGSVPAVVIQDVLLDANSINDTISNGLNVFSAAPNMNVPANNLVGVTVTFISGEQGTYAPMSDTAFLGSVNPNMPFKYGLFRPLTFEETANMYPSYQPGNYNVGQVKFLPESPSWDSLYVPSVAYTAPFEYEHWYIDFKITCNTCEYTTAVGDINNQFANVGNAFPNPAGDLVTVPFSLVKAANVNVTLTNTVGQVISTQNFGKVNEGKATFRVSDLSTGVYFCTVEANGQRVTKRVVVAH